MEVESEALFFVNSLNAVAYPEQAKNNRSLADSEAQPTRNSASNVMNIFMNS